MKKTLLTLTLCLTALVAGAQTKTYNDNLVIRVDDQVTEPIPAEVLVESNTDGTINFNLKNFILILGGERGPVGNIQVENLALTEAGSYQTFELKNDTLTTDDDLLITEGDASVLEEGEVWMGPLLGPIPLDLQGKITNDKLFVNIDISLLGQIINVQFGTDDFPAANQKIYNDNLVIRVDDQVTDPIPAEVIVESNTDGTINFNLKNFILILGGERGPVGNIQVENLALTEAGSYQTFELKNDTLTTDDDLLITEGDASVLEEGEVWMGPLLGPIPLDLQGKITNDKLFVNIDISLLGQIINVQFGTDDFTSGINITSALSKGEGVSAAYDLQGRPVVLSPAKKGLFIVNGKKVLIK